MKNVFSYIIPFYYQQIYKVVSLPIYDGMAPDTEKGSYIILGDRNFTQTEGKNDYLGKCQILLQVVIKSPNFGYKDVDDVISQILSIFNSDNTLTMTDGYQIINTYVISQQYLPSINRTDMVFQGLLRLEHKICQI